MTGNARIITIGLSVLLVMGMTRCATPPVSSPDAPSAAGQVVYLNQFEGTPGELFDYYHTTEGPWLVPFDWFVSLEVAQKPPQEPCDDSMLLASPEILVRLGFLLQPKNPASNPDGLPVGVVRSPEPRDIPEGHPLGKLKGLHWVGVTCAFCHTGELRYKGQAFRVHGGQSMFDSLLFNEALARALVDTKNTPKKFDCFAKRVLKPKPGDDEDKLKKHLQDQITDFLLFGANATPPLKNKETYPTPWGYGRIDAYGRGGNTLLAALIDNEAQVPFGHGDNRMIANASVSIPQIWWAWHYLWVQWNGSIMQPLSRNLTAVTTASRRLLFNPAAPFESDVDVKILHNLEQLTKKIRPPSWPKAFPVIQTGLAKAGKKLYGELCAACHAAGEIVPMQGQKFYNLKMVPIDTIGTDENQAKNFKDRVVTTGRLEPLLGQKTMPAYQFMQLYSNEVRKLKYKDANITGDRVQDMDGFRDNTWRAELAYMARPHAGVWATAPFLHNGSVPTVYALLSPPDEIDEKTGEKLRPDCFYVGPAVEYDPVRLGVVTKPCRNRPDPQDPRSFYDENGFKLDTRFSGNRNRGHEFRAAPANTKGVIKERVLSHDERMQLIEYLKSCELEKVWGKADWDRIKDKELEACP